MNAILNLSKALLFAVCFVVGAPLLFAFATVIFWMPFLGHWIAVEHWGYDRQAWQTGAMTFGGLALGFVIYITAMAFGTMEHKPAKLKKPTVKWITRLKCWLYGHDYDMVFPDPDKLTYILQCEDCGHTVGTFEEALRHQRKLATNTEECDV